MPHLGVSNVEFLHLVVQVIRDSLRLRSFHLSLHTEQLERQIKVNLRFLRTPKSFAACTSRMAEDATCHHADIRLATVALFNSTRVAMVP